MTSLIIINLFFAGFSSLTVTSRICYAMARDKALPMSNLLSYILKKTKTPIFTIFLVFLMDAAFCLLPLGSSTAFAAITSICTIGYQISYAIPILLRITVGRKVFKRSAFHLGALSLPIGWISCIWLIFTSCIFFWPTARNANGKVDKKTCNYTPLVVGGFMLLAMIYWFLPKIGARHKFTGPKIDDDEWKTHEK